MTSMGKSETAFLKKEILFANKRDQLKKKSWK